VIFAATKLHDRYQPQAQPAILFNSSTVGSPTVRSALDLLDLRIMKFDAGSEAMFAGSITQPRRSIWAK
jgi:hypothetical protein